VDRRGFLRQCGCLVPVPPRGRERGLLQGLGRSILRSPELTPSLGLGQVSPGQGCLGGFPRHPADPGSALDAFEVAMGPPEGVEGYLRFVRLQPLAQPMERVGAWMGGNSAERIATLGVRPGEGGCGWVCKGGRSNARSWIPQGE